jgi:hypothetical protein
MASKAQKNEPRHPNQADWLFPAGRVVYVHLLCSMPCYYAAYRCDTWSTALAYSGIAIAGNGICVDCWDNHRNTILVEHYQRGA